MTIFTIKEGAYASVKSKAIRNLILTMPFSILLLFFMGLFDDRNEISTHYLTIPVIIILFVYSTFNALKKQKEILESYKLTITENEITRQQANAPDVIISRNFIGSISKTSKGDIIIKGIDANEQIAVPLLIDRFDELEQLLTSWKEFSLPEKSFLQRNLTAVIVVGLASLIAVNTITNKALLLVSAAVFCATMIWSATELRRNPDTPPKLRKFWGWLIFIMIVVILNAVGRVWIFPVQ